MSKHLSFVILIITIIILPLTFSMHGRNFILSKDQSDCKPPHIDSLDGNFTKLSPLSKYLVLDSKLFNHYEAHRICTQSGLEMAEVKRPNDWTSLKEFIMAQGLSASYWLGSNDRDSEGNYMEDDEITEAQFLAFVEISDSLFDKDTNQEIDCIRTKNVGEYLRMEAVHCELGLARILCQFPKNSNCFINSYQEAMDQQFNDIILMDYNDQRLYISTVQKPWALALETCSKFNLSLFHLQDKILVNQTLESAASFMKQQKMDSQTDFWTDGLPIKSSNGIDAIFWNHNEQFVSLQSLKDIISVKRIDDRVPYGYYSCLSMSFENYINPDETQTSKSLHLQAWNCLVPKYFFCMESNEILNASTAEDIKDNEVDIGIGHHIAELVHTEFEDDLCDFNNPLENTLTVNYIKPLKLNLTGMQSLSEDLTLDLMMFSLKNDLQSGWTKIKIPKVLEWKRFVIDKIFEIFKRSVDSDLVSHSYLNVVREINILFLTSSLYYTSAAGAEEDGPLKQKWIEYLLPVLDDCSQNIKRLKFLKEGLLIKSIIIGGKEKDEVIDITVPNETMEDLFHLDVFVDTLWSIFSFSMGSCYSKIQNSTSWASEYYSLFSLAFMEPLTSKWINDDKLNILKASLIIGDVNVFKTKENIQSSVIAAYISSNILDRRIVRPFFVPQDHHAVNEDQRTS